MGIETAVIIASSREAERVVGRYLACLDFSSSIMIYVPQTYPIGILRIIREYTNRVLPIYDNWIIKPKMSYVGIRNPTDFKDPENMKGFGKSLRIEKRNGDYHFVLDEEPIDYIGLAFMGVAKAFKKNAIGIILEGSGNAGAKGIKEIKKRGGITIAQEASYGMPYKAAQTGKVDYILPPSKIRETLERLVH